MDTSEGLGKMFEGDFADRFGDLNKTKNFTGFLLLLAMLSPMSQSGCAEWAQGSRQKKLLRAGNKRTDNFFND